VLPRKVQAPLQQDLQAVNDLHERDLAEGFGNVYFPYALAKKYPHAGRDWVWHYVFPATKRSFAPRTGIERRHHVAPLVLPRAVKAALRRAGIIKAASCPTFRHNPAYLLMPRST
jgi:hypothetical protein